MLAPCCLPAMVCADIRLYRGCGFLCSFVFSCSASSFSAAVGRRGFTDTGPWGCLGAATPHETWEVQFFDCLCAQSAPEARTCNGVTKKPPANSGLRLSLSLSLSLSRSLTLLSCYYTPPSGSFASVPSLVL